MLQWSSVQYDQPVFLFFIHNQLSATHSHIFINQYLFIIIVYIISIIIMIISIYHYENIVTISQIIPQLYQFSI